MPRANLLATVMYSVKQRYCSYSRKKFATTPQTMVSVAWAWLRPCFDWKLPDGMEPKDVDVSEVSGLAACKKTSLILGVFG